ncbi:amino acid ABC transporter permease [Phyllobacterium sp. 0TCS1.6C]|uniref:amino acid ABC transporter permease n=1 Tax=unclassified Phyllobacterium TaxID=2638441 RepID=UPI00226489FF|nr:MULTISPECIES: amino acid ABC transporter permease [unclassified Phyllobacterium]MCX8281104.1 amino acid ABC transporter permease [Phyllobacterium sp. 0TCS1.6C]MCX8294609.1 amino acid ABC transporter permease [Phyllobacterium sp. 0TCS1.6A]
MPNFNFRPLWRYSDQFIDGVLTTLLLTVSATMIGLIMGIIGAIVLRGGPKPARIAVRTYIEIIRNTPALLQIFIIFFVPPTIGLKFSPIQASIVALSIYFGAYASEILRSGLNSIPASQIEAGLCLGLTRWQVLSRIVLPPAIRNIYPSITSQFVLLLLGTSIASQVSADELFHAAGFIDSRTYRSFEVYALTCGIYFTLVVLSKIAFALVGRAAFRWPTRR